jgi:hypothetical protein
MPGTTGHDAGMHSLLRDGTVAPIVIRLPAGTYPPIVEPISRAMKSGLFMSDRTTIVLVVAMVAMFAGLVLITWYFLEPAKIDQMPR